jgi:hypothetical protein
MMEPVGTMDSSVVVVEVQGTKGSLVEQVENTLLRTTRHLSHSEAQESAGTEVALRRSGFGMPLQSGFLFREEHLLRYRVQEEH